MRLPHYGLAAIVATLAAGAALSMACDPVHNDAIDSLGDEAAGVNTGPTHRPGQPCLLCHDGKLGDPPQFSVAGTVFEEVGSTAPAANVEVRLTSVDNPSSTKTVTTNEAGNFYLTPTEWNPGFPYKVEMKRSNVFACMISHVGRDGSCSGCHVDPIGPQSAGRVVMDQPSALKPDGGCLPW